MEKMKTFFTKKKRKIKNFISFSHVALQLVIQLGAARGRTRAESESNKKQNLEDETMHNYAMSSSFYLANELPLLKGYEIDIEVVSIGCHRS